jgi:hypothetical protein
MPELRTAIEFGGQTFPVSSNSAELGITHAVCGVHSIRGPMVIRWMKYHPRPDDRRKEILAETFKLYGSAVTGIKFVDIYQ